MLSEKLVTKSARLTLQALLLLIPLSWGYLTREPYAISTINIISLLFIALVVLALLTKELRLGWPSDRSFTVMISLFVGALLYAGFFTHPLRDAIGLWVSRLFQPLLVGYGAYLLFRAQRLTIKDCLWPVLLSLIPLALLGFGQFTHLLPYKDSHRVTANYLYPNTFARYVVYVMVLTLPWLLAVLPAGRRWLTGLIWLAGLGLLIGSLSFGATIAFFAALVVITLGWPKLPQRWKAGLLVSLIVALAAIALVYHATPKWQTSLTDSLATRREFWHVAWGVTKDHFWTGIGLKTWEHHYGELVTHYVSGLPLNWSSAQPHDVYLDSFVKAGLPGFIGIIGFMVWPLLAGWRLLKRPSTQWWFGLGLVGLAVVMLVFGLADDPLWSDDVMPLIAVMYFLLAGLSGTSLAD